MTEKSGSHQFQLFQGNDTNDSQVAQEESTESTYPLDLQTAMFRKRQNSQKPGTELYAQFRQSHGSDVAAGTEPPILLPVHGSEYFEKSCATTNDVGMNQYESSDNSFGEVPWLSGGSTLSPENDASASPVAFMTDEFALGGMASSYQKSEEFFHSPIEGLRQTIPPSPAQDVWSQFTEQDNSFHSQATQASYQGMASSAWPDTRPTLPLADDEGVVIECKGAVEPYENDHMDSFSNENDSMQIDLQIQAAEETRFCHRLDAPPAMPKESGERPVTYLNKGSHYSLLVEDTSNVASRPGKMLYCTSIQVAFDTESRRQCPAASWKLWDQSRGANEGHLFDGRFQAIEYLESHKSDSHNHQANVQVVHSDGFSLLWSAESNNSRQCNIDFQLNFLSTDFNHVKGVHGATMQLCSKTEEISPISLQFPMADLTISFCRIQLFRSHGAERKMSNDIATAEKRIERLKQQLSHSQARPMPKDKRLEKNKKKAPSMAEHSRKQIRTNHEDDLRCRIKNLRDICNSTPQHSFLDQQGDKQEHCDCYPGNRDLEYPATSKLDATWSPSDEWSTSQPVIVKTEEPASPSSSPTLHSPPVMTKTSQQQALSVMTDAASVGDSSAMKYGGDSKVACFYIRLICSKSIAQSDRYTPIYLFERTACELVRRIAAVVAVDPAEVLRTVWCSAKHLDIIVDDDVVLSMSEGQDMQVAIIEVPSSSSSSSSTKFKDEGSEYESFDDDEWRDREEMSQEVEKQCEFRLLF